jgi:hypothetical protein
MTTVKAVIAVALVALVGCKRNADHASAGVAARTKPVLATQDKPVLATPKKVIGTHVTAVRCNLVNTPEGENWVAATRHLHLGPNNKLYYFSDYHGPTRLDPVDGGCGYRVGETLEAPKDGEFGLEPDGGFKVSLYSDDSPLAKCKRAAFTSLRYGHGALVAGTYYARDDDELVAMDLNSPTCEPTPATLAELPQNNEGLTPWVSWAGNDLLLAYGRSDWHYDREVFRFDARGHLVTKYGSGDKRHEVGGDAYGCGDGLCVVTGAFVWMDVLDATGTRVASYNTQDWIKLPQSGLQTVVEVPGKGVYALFGYLDPQSKGHAELVRLDGID